jgi:glycosyltransferase involved in cell wall biosynthesis
MNSNKLIKVLHITQAAGGVKTYITNIIEYSDSTRFLYAVACPQSDMIDWKKQEGVAVFQVDLIRPPSIIKDIKALRQTLAVIREFKPDILHAHSGKGGFIGRLAGRLTHTRTVFTPNAFSYLGFKGISRTIFKALELMGRRWTDVLLAVSESERRRAVDELHYDRRKTVVVPNSINIVKSSNSSMGVQFKNHIGMIGRLLEQKNPEMFIRVAVKLHNQFPDCRFSLLGEGYHDYLKNRIYRMVKESQAEKYVRILKWGDIKDALEFIESCDIFVLTSRFEGLPFSLLEALSLKVPVVATNVDGICDIITDGIDGLLVKPDDDNAMVESISRLLNNRTLMQSMGRKGQNTVQKKFNISKNIKEIEEVYSNI